MTKAEKLLVSLLLLWESFALCRSSAAFFRFSIRPPNCTPRALAGGEGCLRRSFWATLRTSVNQTTGTHWGQNCGNPVTPKPPIIAYAS